MDKGKMAGVAGFEPAHGDTKNRCLTAWLHPNILRWFNLPKVGWKQNTSLTEFTTVKPFTLPARLNLGVNCARRGQESVVQHLNLIAERQHHRDNRQRYTGRYEAIFNRRSRFCVLHIGQKHRCGLPLKLPNIRRLCWACLSSQTQICI